MLLFDMTLKGAILITMALLVTRLRLIHSPAWRSLVWTGLLTALLALPLAPVLLPELRMPGLLWIRKSVSGFGQTPMALPCLYRGRPMW